MLEAEQAEARLKAGDERPLLGVPIAIKDEVDVVGEVNMHGTDAFTEPATADCEMVRRLREAGAIVVGLAFWVEFRFAPRLWLHAVLWPVVTIPLAVLMMRPAKAALVALQFRHRASEMEL